MNNIFAFIYMIPVFAIQIIAVLLHVLCSLAVAIIATPFALAFMVYALVISKKKDEQ